MQKLDVTYTQHRIEYRRRIRQLLRVIEAKDKQLVELMSGGKSDEASTTEAPRNVVIGHVNSVLDEGLDDTFCRFDADVLEE